MVWVKITFPMEVIKNMNQKNAFSLIIVTLMASVLLAMSVSGSYASTHIQVSGSIIITGATISANAAGESDNRMVHISSTGMYTGDIAGSYTGEALWIVHNVSGPMPLMGSSRNTHNVATFSSATVMGKTGTLTIMLVGNPSGESWVIIGGTDELESLHGQGTLAMTGAMMGKVANYEGTIHFDP